MPRDRHHARGRQRDSAASKVDLAIFVIGLIAAVIAGVVAYKKVGLYGDGAFSSGYHRIRDPETGKSLLVHESHGKDGSIIRRIVDGTTLKEVRLAGVEPKEEVRAHVEGTKITRVDRDRDGDGRIDAWEYYDDNRKLVKVGFSLPGDGVLDAWAYRDAKGRIVKIEVSTRRDGIVNRWEYYENDKMVRVEEDTNGDGRSDRLSTYEDGILMRTLVDRDGDGQYDGPVR